MDNTEREVDDGVNTFKVLTMDKHFVPGGGATKIELVKQITSYKRPVLDLNNILLRSLLKLLKLSH